MMDDIRRLRPALPRMLALGEPTHGEDDLLRLRNRLFRQLVEEHGYRTIALESDCLRGLIVDDFIGGGDGSLDAVMASGFSHEWGAFEGNRELVRWMRAHNEGRPGADRVRFAGFDGPLEISGGASPREALTGLHRYLAERIDPSLLPCSAETLDRLIGDDGRWPEPAAMMDPSRSVGRTPEAVELRLIADDLVALLDEHTPEFPSETARLYGRTATGLLRYHHWMADSTSARLTRLLGVRDSMMAANLLALRGRTLVFAHNSHLQRTRSSMRMGGPLLHWWGAGALVDAQLGDDYGFFAIALGTIRHQGVEAPPPDTLEGILYAGPANKNKNKEPYSASPSNRNAEPNSAAPANSNAEPNSAAPANSNAEPNSAALANKNTEPNSAAPVDVVDPAELAGRPMTARVSPWFGYAPFDPAGLDRVDGIVFVKDVGASAPPETKPTRSA
ncbi:erythromycin esterase family protein [Actinoplanes bogorensis]|uniref:Erythromycin esterase family protein n=2 Tax=Paractinoplanes bogorensis TaxID=1610840 RepID=A0ABS5YN28_9ACTN|nr:erythromycin esterase family protein [Actinoplanes bogorensis]